jgi:ribosomal protein S2
MTKYVWDRKSSGVHMFDVQKQWEKIQIAARIIASIPDPSTIIVYYSNIGCIW